MHTNTLLTQLQRLQEAYTQRRVLAAHTKGVKKLQPIIERFFAAQAAKVVKAFSSGVLKEAKNTVDTKFDQAVAASDKRFVKLLQKAIEELLAAGANDAVQNIPLGISFSLRNPRAVQYAKSYAAQLITEVNSTTKDQVRRIVAEHIEAGKSYTELAKALRTHYAEFNRPPLHPTGRHIQSRAEHIAITEVSKAYNTGSFFAVINAQQRTGVKFEKQWLTVGDNRVSTGCKDNAAQGWLDVDTEHSSGHFTPPRFPGCRCTEQYRRKV